MGWRGAFNAFNLGLCRQKAEGRKQKAEGRRQKAESRRQKAESRRQKAESRRRKAEGRKRKAEGRDHDPEIFLALSPLGERVARGGAFFSRRGTSEGVESLTSSLLDNFSI